jgi:hypothetical protein
VIAGLRKDVVQAQRAVSFTSADDDIRVAAAVAKKLDLRENGQEWL